MILKRPHLMIVGGPNGSGKTTIARELEDNAVKLRIFRSP